MGSELFSPVSELGMAKSRETQCVVDGMIDHKAKLVNETARTIHFVIKLIVRGPCCCQMRQQELFFTIVGLVLPFYYLLRLAVTYCTKVSRHRHTLRGRLHHRPPRGSHSLQRTHAQ